MLGIDPEIGASALRLWMAAGSAAVLVGLCALVFMRPESDLRGSVLRVGIVVAGAVLGASITWAFAGGAATPNLVAERHALEMRADQLGARAYAPGSPLACLDVATGESLEAACEKAVFAAPASAAAAISYVRAKLALLGDMAAYTRHGGIGIDSAMLPLRRSLETDAFGFLAYALAISDGCTGDHCPALAILSDPSLVRANLRQGRLDRYLEHYLTVWAQQPERPLAEAGATRGLGTPGETPPHKLVDIDFPSAASIPPVSIMNPEPKGPMPPPVASNGAPPPPARPAVPERAPHKHAAEGPAPAAAPAAAPEQPYKLAAPSSPVWMPGAPAAPARAAAAPPPANAGPPVDLNPFVAAPQPEATANMMHTQ